MNGIATLPPADRRALFQEAANRRGLSFAVIEKDFWVCWTLARVFGLAPLGQHLIFKGGTSLSKVFGVIERFSEDIDLSIRRDYLGAVGHQDPEQEGISRNRSQQRVEALRASSRRCVQEEMLPALREAFAASLGNEAGWHLKADADVAGTLLFHYPQGRPAEAAGRMAPLPAYIRPQVKLEMGAGSDAYPLGSHVLRPYAAEELR